MLDKVKPVVIALGYFDSVHLGHQAVIKSAVKLAESLSATPVVFSFSKSPKAVIEGVKEDKVYLNREREDLFLSLGVKGVFFAPATKKFLSNEGLEFLLYLNNKFNVLGYVCGEDFRFGKGGIAGVEMLKDFAKDNGQSIEIVKLKTLNGEKVSTTAVKSLLECGDIFSANKMLNRAYSYSGRVFRDRKVGKKLGYPTVNIKAQNGKIKIKFGVYSGHVFIEGKRYNAVINYGNRPTFNLVKPLLEAHIIDFTGNLYGKKLTVYFDNYLRDIITFAGAKELKAQIEKDVLAVKERKIND